MHRPFIGPAVLAAAALFAAFAFVSSLKSVTERTTLRIVRYRKERRRQRHAALTVRG